MVVELIKCKCGGIVRNNNNNNFNIYIAQNTCEYDQMRIMKYGKSKVLICEIMGFVISSWFTPMEDSFSVDFI